jgi:predicted DNA-binding transcriptional regulator AlpA
VEDSGVKSERDSDPNAAHRISLGLSREEFYGADGYLEHAVEWGMMPEHPIAPLPMPPGGAPQRAPAAPASPWLTRPEAAAHCRVSLRTFDEHVAPRLTGARIGGRVVFSREEIDAWLGTPKDGASEKKKVVRRTSFASVSPVNVSSDPRALAIRGRLRRRQSGSIPMPSNGRPSSGE